MIGISRSLFSVICCNLCPSIWFLILFSKSFVRFRNSLTANTAFMWYLSQKWCIRSPSLRNNFLKCCKSLVTTAEKILFYCILRCDHLRREDIFPISEPIILNRMISNLRWIQSTAYSFLVLKIPLGNLFTFGDRRKGWFHSYQI